jgi:hypothetical protein
MVTEEINLPLINTDLMNISSRTGTPVSFKPSPQILAVSTTKGLIVLYDTTTLARIGILGIVEKEESNFKTVTVMDWGPVVARPAIQKPGLRDARLLAAAYSNGTICVWNTETFQPITTMKNECKGATKIISLYPIGNDVLYSFLVCDPKSTEMKQYTFPKTSNAIRVTPVPILHPENAHTVWDDIQLLPKAEGNSIYDQFHILAIACRDHVIIQMINPIVTTLRLIQNPILGSVHSSVLAKTKSCIAWKQSMLLDGEYTTQRWDMDEPMLAVSFAGSNRLQFYRTKCQIIDEEEDITIEFDNEMAINPNHFSSWIYRINWLSDRVLTIAVNNNKRLLLVDRVLNNVVETVIDDNTASITNTDSLHYFPASQTQNRTFSISHKSATLYLMNEKHVLRAFSIRNWQDRIDRLYKVGLYSPALDMCVELYLNPDNIPAVVGLPKITAQRKQLVGKIISAHLRHYAEQAIMNRHLEDDPQSVYLEIGRTCLHYCMDIRNNEIIWDLVQLYTRDSMEYVLITILAECILQGKLQLFENVQLPSEELLRYQSKQLNIFNMIVRKYEHTNIEMLENIILNVDLSAMKEELEFETVSRVVLVN